MCAKTAYKPTFFDRHGADGGLYLRAAGGGALVLGVLASGLALFGLLTLGAIIGCVCGSLIAVCSRVRDHDLQQRRLDL